MSENNNPEQSLALLDAELTFGEADAKLRALFKEFRPQGYVQLPYDYIDPKDDSHHLVTVLGENFSTPRTRYLIHTAHTQDGDPLTKEQDYVLEFVRTSSSAGSLNTSTEVFWFDANIGGLVPADEAQQLELADTLSHLDVDMVRTDIRKLIADHKAHRSSWLGRLLGGRQQ